MEECAEQDVDDRVDRPDCWVSDNHFSGLPQDVPEQQQIHRDRSGYDRPDGRAKTGHAVSQQTYETADGQRGEDVWLAVDDIEPESPGQSGEEDCDVEQDGCGQAVEHSVGLQSFPATRRGEVLIKLIEEPSGVRSAGLHKRITQFPDFPNTRFPKHSMSSAVWMSVYGADAPVDNPGYLP